VSPHKASPAALCKSCIKRLPGAIKGCLVLASSCVIAASLQTPASALVTRGGSIYTLVNDSSWTGAQAESFRLGGNLVTVNDFNEEDFLYNTFGSTLPVYSSVNSPAGALWIGLTDKDVEGVYKWISGDTSTWLEDTYRGTGGWIQNSDSDAQDYMILRRNALAARGYDWDDYWGNNSPWSGAAVYQGIAEIAFQSFNGNAYVRVQGSTLQDAIANALELGGTIVDNPDPTESAWLASAFSGEPTDRIARIPFSGSSASVPGPLPVFGAAAAFGFSRKLRRRIQGR
jgi:hypothetical protein